MAWFNVLIEFPRMCSGEITALWLDAQLLLDER